MHAVLRLCPLPGFADMALVDLKVMTREGRLPADVDEFVEEANARVVDFIDNGNHSITGFVPSDFDIVYHTLEAIAENNISPGNVFCEWGCGIGAIAMLAAMLEFQAYGIEIERSLVDESRILAEDFDLSVEFVAGSFIPQGGEPIVEEHYTGEHCWLTSNVDDAYPQLGLGPGDFDVVYAFPWPGEEHVIASLFDEFASVGAILLTYGQIEGVRVRRKVITK
jgi:hypothetical protein